MWAENSIQHLNPVILNHRIAQHVACNGVQIFARLHRNLEKLTLPDILDSCMSQAIERGTNGLTLRIENRRFECDEYAGFHAFQFTGELAALV